MAKAKATIVFSHWYTLLENFNTSSKEFYTSVERAIDSRQVPQAKTSRVDWREGGIFTVKREYMRVRRKDHVFDICGAPFGTGFFVSWWLGELPSGIRAFLSEIPVIGFLFRWLIRPATYYRRDTALMFQEAVRRAVNDVIDEWTETKGLRALSEGERKPILRELFQK